MQKFSESTFFLPYSFASAINAFFFPYILSVLWIRIIEALDLSRKLTFLKKLWWAGFVLMVLFWIMTASIALLADTMPILNGATVYPPLDALEKPQSIETNFISNYSAAILSTILSSLVTVIQSIILCTTIWISGKIISQNVTRTIIFWSSAFTGLAGLAFLIVNGFFLGVLLSPNVFLSDIYIAGPSLSQAPKPNIWSIVAFDNWDGIAIIFFLILFFFPANTKKQLSNVSLIFGLLAVLSVLKKIYLPAEVTQLRLDITFIDMHSPVQTGSIYYGIIAVIYQLILWNEQRLIRWLAYIHIIILLLVEVILLAYTPHRYYSASAEFILALHNTVSRLFPSTIGTSQLFVLFNYWLSNSKPSK